MTTSCIQPFAGMELGTNAVIKTVRSSPLLSASLGTNVFSTILKKSQKTNDMRAITESWACTPMLSRCTTAANVLTPSTMARTVIAGSEERA